MDDSYLTVLPIPVVAFFVPHIDLTNINANNYLKQGGSTRHFLGHAQNRQRRGGTDRQLGGRPGRLNLPDRR